MTPKNLATPWRLSPEWILYCQQAGLPGHGFRTASWAAVHDETADEATGVGLAGGVGDGVAEAVAVEVAAGLGLGIGDADGLVDGGGAEGAG